MEHECGCHGADGMYTMPDMVQNVLVRHHAGDEDKANDRKPYPTITAAVRPRVYGPI